MKIILEEAETEDAICERLKNLLQSYPNSEITIVGKRIRIICYQRSDCIKLYLICITREELELLYEMSVHSYSELMEAVESWFKMLISSKNPVLIRMICLLNYYECLMVIGV